MNESCFETSQINVLVTDTDALAMRLLTAELRRQNRFDVFQCSASPSGLSDGIVEHSISILLYGSNSKDFQLSGLGSLKKVRAEFPHVRSIALVDSTDQSLTSELFRAGVKGVYERSEYEIQRLCHCIQCVSSGRVWANSRQLAAVLDAFAESSPAQELDLRAAEVLTPRERDVVRLVADGYANREIAAELRLSTHTVKNYLFNVFDKLGVANRAELIMYLLSTARLPTCSNSRPRNQVSAPPVRLSRVPCGAS